jgi:hypothetical protein
VILFTGLVAGTGPEHLDIAIPGSVPAPLSRAILEFFLNRSIASHPVLCMQAAACLVANALTMSLLPGCHDGSRSKDEDQHCT